MHILSIINYAFHYTIQTCNRLNIDESHGLRHSMDVYHFANKIYDSETYVNPFLKGQKNIIMCSAILHDMCDKKYININDGINDMNLFMKDYINDDELQIINKIISTMSYSTVKKNGYPEMQQYNLAYHIVRESDLLAAYDVERCIIYQMMHEGFDYISSLKSAKELFETRVLKYIDDGLFITSFSKATAQVLHEKAVIKLAELDKIYYSHL